MRINIFYAKSPASSIFSVRRNIYAYEWNYSTLHHTDSVQLWTLHWKLNYQQKIWFIAEVHILHSILLTYQQVKAKRKLKTKNTKNNQHKEMITHQTRMPSSETEMETSTDVSSKKMSLFVLRGKIMVYNDGIWI